jgi:heparosan-N-sulfate-glucuronate 5-epimerase
MTARQNRKLRVVLLLIFFLTFLGEARADLFPEKSFKVYHSNGSYPLWSKSWVGLERRVFIDGEGIPYVNYDTGKSYNTTTISLFGLLAYNRFLDTGSAADKEDFLRLAKWIARHQDESCGCWYHDFDFTYLTLGETLHKPWISAMTQGLAISMMTRAYHLTWDPHYLAVAEKSLLPFSRNVEDGGVARPFRIGGVSSPCVNCQFYEEYPTQPDATYTLNGFMFSLLGLYDLAQTPNAQAEELFQKGLRTLQVALPLYDLGTGSAYDLGHLTRPPRPIHSDLGYHLVHLVLLNAIGSATEDANLLWYRDHWNSYGNLWDVSELWLVHFGVWLVFRRTALVLVTGLILTGRFLWIAFSMWRRRRSAAADSSLPNQLSPRVNFENRVLPPQHSS